MIYLSGGLRFSPLHDHGSFLTGTTGAQLNFSELSPILRSPCSLSNVPCLAFLIETILTVSVLRLYPSLTFWSLLSTPPVSMTSVPSTSAIPAHSLVDRTKLRWHRRNQTGHADALTRKVAIRAADFKSKFYAVPLMSIAHCINDKDAVAAAERQWILNLGSLANGLNVVLPVDKSIWIADRPGRWLLDIKNVRFPEVAIKINGVLQSSFHQVSGSVLADQFDFLTANRARTVLRWLELYPDSSDSVVATTSAAIVLARGRLTASLRQKARSSLASPSPLPHHCSSPPAASSTPTGLSRSPADSVSSPPSSSVCTSDVASSNFSASSVSSTLFLKIPYLSSVVEARSVRGLINSELSRSLAAGLFEPSCENFLAPLSPP